ncbi:MAG TPA: response regulator transcription factor [Pyrinomonadaceae bacterium]|nr:response regulator transcription factor [Pyrinomonadaceae bacterium]
MIKVLIADDHTIVRHGLKQILAADPQIDVCCEAQNGNEVIDFVRQRPVDVVVMDITMPGRNGLETLKDLKRIKPELPVLILSMHPQDQYAVRVLKAGAAGYITKESAPEELVAAIKKANQGHKHISPDVAELLAMYIERGNNEEAHKTLSDREFEVLVMIGQGRSLTEISDALFLSVKTVSTYRSRILEKTGLPNNAAITRYCVQHGLS